MIAASASINAAAPGFLEGHLKIGSLSPNIIKPADVLTQTLQERKERTTLHLSKYCQNASENLEKSDGDLCLTGPGFDVARVRSSLWPETTQAPSRQPGGKVGGRTGRAEANSRAPRFAPKDRG